jgi:hypothetical protein
MYRERRLACGPRTTAAVGAMATGQEAIAQSSHTHRCVDSSQYTCTYSLIHDVCLSFSLRTVYCLPHLLVQFVVLVGRCDRALPRRRRQRRRWRHYATRYAPPALFALSSDHSIPSYPSRTCSSTGDMRMQNASSKLRNALAPKYTSTPTPCSHSASYHHHPLPRLHLPATPTPPPPPVFLTPVREVVAIRTRTDASAGTRPPRVCTIPTSLEISDVGRRGSRDGALLTGLLHAGHRHRRPPPRFPT